MIELFFSLWLLIVFAPLWIFLLFIHWFGVFFGIVAYIGMIWLFIWAETLDRPKNSLITS